MKPKFTIRWGRWENPTIEFHHYASSGEHAIVLRTADGEPLATATVALWPPCPMADRTQVWLKDWGGNEGLPEALEAAGVLKLNGITHPTGYALARLADLTPAAFEAIAARPERDLHTQAAVYSRELADGRTTTAPIKPEASAAS